MTDNHYWTICACVPAAIIAVVAAYSAGAGCYAITMNCFSIVEPDGAVSSALFFAAKLAPFAGPSYAPLALAAFWALHRFGAARAAPWFWTGPPLFALLLHAACVVFAGTTLPHRRLQPSLAFDAAVLGVGLAWLALCHFGQRAVEARRSRRSRTRRSWARTEVTR